MDIKNDLRKGRSCVFLLHAHLVFVTKYRKKVFSSKHLTAMEIVFEEVCTDFEARLSQFEGEGDHVHPVGELSSEGIPFKVGE